MKRALYAAVLAGALALSGLAGSGSAASSAVPCGTNLNTAYQSAGGGDTLTLGACSYPGVTLANAPGKGQVTFQGVPGTVVSDVTVQTSNVEFRDVKISSDAEVLAPSPVTNISNVTFRNLTAARFYAIGNVSNVNVVGGSYGPSVDNHSQVKAYNSFDGGYPSQVTVDGATFHDSTRSGSGVHTECLQIIAGSDIVVRNSRFTNCDGTSDIAVAADMGPTSRVTVENNWFDNKGDSGFAAQLSAAVKGLTFQYNSSTWPVIVNNPCNACGFVFRANVLPFSWSFCAANATYIRNVIAGGTCSASDRNAPSGFVNAAAFDLHLATGSAAIDGGDATSFPSGDIDGDSRPAGNGPDAGADESGAAAPAPPPPPPPPPPPTPPAYAPACAPTCDAQIADLKTRIAKAQSDLQQP